MTVQWHYIYGFLVVPGHDGTVHSINWSHSGQWVVSGSADRTARLWTPTQKDPLLTISNVQASSRLKTEVASKVTTGVSTTGVHTCVISIMSILTHIHTHTHVHTHAHRLLELVCSSQLAYLTPCSTTWTSFSSFLLPTLSTSTSTISTLTTLMILKGVVCACVYVCK